MEKRKNIDKFFLLTYTCIGYDGFRHSCHAWFATEEKLRSFVEDCRAKKNGIEIDLSIEILSHREILL